MFSCYVGQVVKMLRSLREFGPSQEKKLIQKFKLGFIQFNKIFIQLENLGIEDHYMWVKL